MKAFTLVELIVTVAIIAVMAVFSITAFSRNGTHNDFAQKTAEVRDSLNQMYVKTINPEKGTTGYYAQFNNDPTNSIDLVRVGATTTTVASIKLANGMTLDSSFDGLYCDVLKKICCTYTTTIPDSCAASSSGNILTLSNPSLPIDTNLTLYAVPFAVK